VAVENGKERASEFGQAFCGSGLQNAFGFVGFELRLPLQATQAAD
jgi:hypothetical protein